MLYQFFSFSSYSSTATFEGLAPISHCWIIKNEKIKYECFFLIIPRFFSFIPLLPLLKFNYSYCCPNNPLILLSDHGHTSSNTLSKVLTKAWYSLNCRSYALTCSQNSRLQPLGDSSDTKHITAPRFCTCYVSSATPQSHDPLAPFIHVSV